MSLRNCLSQPQKTGSTLKSAGRVGLRALEWGIILVTCHSHAYIMELRLFCASRASGERSCITLPVADWAAQTEALEAACPVGAAHQLVQSKRCPATICGELVASNVRASTKPVTRALVNVTQASIRLDRFVGHASRAVSCLEQTLPPLLALELVTASEGLLPATALLPAATVGLSSQVAVDRSFVGFPSSLRVLRRLTSCNASVAEPC